MPKGTEAPIFSTVTSDGYVWGNQGGVFGRWPTGSILGVDGANGADGTNGLDGYNITNNTSASSDLLLATGDVAYINYTSATSVLLHIQTEEGLYEVNIVSTSPGPTSPNGVITLTPNNSTQTGISYVGFDISEASLTAASTVNNTYFLLGEHLCLESVSRVNTYTGRKSIANSYFKQQSAGTLGRGDYNQYWTDTTTAWTSLGTITFPFAQSGKIVIHRIV